MLNPENDKYTKEYLKENVKVLDGNEVYRVTDVLRCHCNPELENVPDFLKELSERTEYEGTILRQYIDRTNGPPFNYRELKKIVNEHVDKIEPYNEDHILIHLRTGDDYANRGLGNPRNVKLYLKQINKFPIDKTIVLVTTMHYGHAEFDSLYLARTWRYSEKSREKNIDLLHDFIKKIPHKVKIQSDIDTDIDFLHLILAKKILTLNTTGGFSKVVNTLNGLFR